MIINFKSFFDYGKNSGLVRERVSPISSNSKTTCFPTSILPRGTVICLEPVNVTEKGSGPVAWFHDSSELM